MLEKGKVNSKLVNFLDKGMNTKNLGTMNKPNVNYNNFGPAPTCL